MIKILTTILAVLLLTSIAQADITTGLQAWWKFDEGSGTTALDSSGNSNNGTLTNSPLYVTGKIGPYALIFSPASSYVSTGAVSGLTLTSFTFAAWINVTAYPVFSAYAAIVHNDIGGSPTGIYEESTSGFVVVAGGGTGVAKWLIPASSVPIGGWHHIVATYDGTTYAMYLDGVAAGSTYVDSNYSDGAVPYAIGRGNASYFNGSIDDVRIYNRALSSSDVTQLYNYTGATVKNIGFNYGF